MYDKVNNKSGRIKTTKIIIDCQYVLSESDPEFDGITEWDETDSYGNYY
jgi:hypothetical protein